MTGQETFTIGARVKPANDGLDIRWTLLRGTILDCWQDGSEYRVEVRWDQHWGRHYGTRLPAFWLEEVQ